MKLLKRIFDLLMAITGIFLLLPLLCIISILIWLKLGWPIFFCQERPGLWGKPFLLYKFRTMTDRKGRDGKLLSDQERLTPLGVFLRSTSLDELPELVNVIKGDLSLVGPRPLLMRYLPYFTEREQLRHSVRPGITGLAQISGRNYLPWDERLGLDVWYVENWTLWLDVKILFQTIRKVFAREGVSACPGEVEKALDQERSNEKVSVVVSNSSPTSDDPSEG